MIKSNLVEFYINICFFVIIKNAYSDDNDDLSKIKNNVKLSFVGPMCKVKQQQSAIYGYETVVVEERGQNGV